MSNELSKQQYDQLVEQILVDHSNVIAHYQHQGAPLLATIDACRSIIVGLVTLATDNPSQRIELLEYIVEAMQDHLGKVLHTTRDEVIEKCERRERGEDVN